MATKAGAAYIEIRGEDKRLQGDLNAAHRKVENSAMKMQNSASQAFKRIGIAAMAAGAVVAVVSLKILALGREFESTMKTVQAWSGAAGKELKDLTNIAREMGATTEWTANQSASALKYLAAAGFTAKQSIEALPGTLDLATAGQVDLARATDITTDVLTAFGMQVRELDRVSDAFITTSSSSNTNVLMLGESFKMVAPTAKLFGLNVEKTAGFLGTLANSGIKAEMAGSGLNMVLMKSARAAKMLGIDAMTPLIDVLKKMKEEEWDAVKIGKAFGVRQVKTAAILMNNIDMYEKLTQKIIENKGATKDLAEIIRDSLDNDLKVLNSTIQDEMLSVYDEYKGSLRDIIQETTTWIQKNDELIKQDVFAAVDKITNSISNLISIYNSLPEGVIGAAGAGLVGRILFGGWGPAKIVAGLYLINDGMATLGMGLGDIVKSYEEAVDAFQKIGDVIAGRRDPSTGLIYHKMPEYEVKTQAQKMEEMLAKGAPTRLDVALEDPDRFYGKRELAPPAVPETVAVTEEEYKVWEDRSDMQTKMIDEARERQLAYFEKSLELRRAFSGQDLEAIISAEQAKLDMQFDFDMQYAEMGKSRFDLEREQLDRQVEAWRAAKFKEDQINRSYSDKSIKIAQAEQQAKLSIYQNIAGGIANTFQQIAQAGGKQSKEAFKVYKAFAMVEAGIAGYKAVLQAMAAYPPPFSFVMAGIAGAAAVVQIGLIAASKPPSYKTGIDYVPQTGLAMLHEGEQVIPKIKARKEGGKQTIINVNLTNPVFQDLETQRQVMAQIASVVATQVAPGAVIENYENDGPIRSIVRGGV